MIVQNALESLFVPSNTLMKYNTPHIACYSILKKKTRNLLRPRRDMPPTCLLKLEKPNGGRKRDDKSPYTQTVAIRFQKVILKFWNNKAPNPKNNYWNTINNGLGVFLSYLLKGSRGDFRLRQSTGAYSETYAELLLRRIIQTNIILGGVKPTIAAWITIYSCQLERY